MIRRSTWIVLSLFALALAVVWVLQSREDQNTPAATLTPLPALVFAQGASTPVRIQLRSSESQALELVNKGMDGWQIVEPPLGAADPNQVTNLINSLLTMEIAAELEAAPSDQDMGLDEPAFAIQLTWQDAQVQILTIGNITPTSSRYYARLDGGKPMLISMFAIADVTAMLDTPPVLAASTPVPVTEPNPSPQP